MKKLPIIILASSAMVAPLNFSVGASQAKPFIQGFKQSENACEQALETVVRRIQNVGNITVDLQANEIPSYWEAGAPSGRPYQVKISLGKPGERSYQIVENIMSSTQMLTAMANEVIEGCERASVVTYGVWGSGYLRTFGLIDGTVREFDYIEPLGSTQLRWGLEYSN